MKIKQIPWTAALALPLLCAAQDPAQTDGDKYKVLLDNKNVRVLEYTDAPGEQTLMHRHPAFVLYALAPFERVLRLADGRVVRRKFNTGDVMFSEGESHIGQNIGDTPTRVLMVELKGDHP